MKITNQTCRIQADSASMHARQADTETGPIKAWITWRELSIIAGFLLQRDLYKAYKSGA